MATEPEEKGEAKAVKSARERLAEKKHKQGKPSAEEQLSFLQKVRGYADALVFAFLLAMSIRTYVFELFMIPTGSMTPTLIGDTEGEVVFAKYDDDDVEDVVYTFRSAGGYPSDELQIFLMNEDGSCKDLIFLEGVPRTEVVNLIRQSKRRTDMIVVNKFAYWFSPPRRGDIAVFKVPYRPSRNPQWEVDKLVYIKRVIGLPGETITVQPSEIITLGPADPNRYGNIFGGREVHLRPRPILADDEPLPDSALPYNIHFPRPDRASRIPGPTDSINIEYVDDDSVLMLGDNAASSSDGRYWGAVPLDHFRGKAILRYWPWEGVGFLGDD